MILARKRPALVLWRMPSTVWSFKLMRFTATPAASDFRVHRKTVILRRNFDPAGFQILHRLVRAAMAEFQFEGFPAECLPENLVPETNPENRNAAVTSVFTRGRCS